MTSASTWKHGESGDAMKAKAYGKLNLSLDVLARREDGYHDLCMVMQTVALADELTLTAQKEEGIRVRTNLRYLPRDDRNLAAAAAKVYQRRAGGDWDGLLIEIEKHIPVCAGMAGGSSDAAAVLRSLNQCALEPLPLERLARLGEEVGSDVPYCVLGGTALAEGKGERLTALPPLPDCHIVLCKPPFSIPTPELFGCIDCRKIRCRPDTGGIIAALEQKDLVGVARRMYNVFEDVLTDHRGQEIREIKSELLSCGALGAAMSGTGPTVFGLFDRLELAQQALDSLKDRYEDVFLTSPTGNSDRSK